MSLLDCGTYGLKQFFRFSLITQQQQQQQLLLLLLLLLLTTAIDLSLGGNSPYTSIDKTNYIHKRNNT